MPATEIAVLKKPKIMISDGNDVGVYCCSDSSAVALPSALSYRDLEEQVNKWTLELEEHEKVFIQQATQINAWDKILMENSVKVCIS